MDNLRKGLRFLLLGVLCFLPRDQRRKIDRWLRGREEFKQLQRADWVLMSWGKSGRTWLRVMLSRFYQLHFGFEEDVLLDFDNLRAVNPQAPAVFFTHNNYLRDYTGNWESKAHFVGKRIVLLVRDPRDVAVSQYFQWKFRMKRGKKYLNDYPDHGSDVALFDFVMNPLVGVPRIVDYFNAWMAAISELENVLVIRYEDMRSEPRASLAKILEFTGTPASEAEVLNAVEFAAYDNMKKMEEDKHFRAAGSRVRAGDDSNPDSFKVRKAKVGGYRDYFDDEQCATLDKLIATLDPRLRYQPGLDAPNPREQS